MSDFGEADPSLGMITHFEQATHIPFAQAEHFEREGFSGDVLVPKEAGMGFSALQVNVHGAHPLKEILKGNTCTYFVTDGVGTFVLNGEQRVVGKGDLVVIPAGSQYEYEGEMTLFEFNVSPRNTFRERVVDLSEEQPIVPRREKVAHAVAEILKRGYVLTSPELKEISHYYGYRNNSFVCNNVRNPSFWEILRASGVKWNWVMHKGYAIYLDGNLADEETDLAETVAIIDAASRKHPFSK